MRTVSASVVLGVLLALPTSAAAKGGGVRFCGTNGCRTTYDLALLTQVLPALAARDGAALGPPPASPYYRVGFPNADWSTAYYVLAPRLVRVAETEVVEWRRANAAAAFESATRGISPFASPRVIRGMVGSRTIRRPQSYLRLYDLVGRGDRVPDPVGRRPALKWRNYNALVRYYRRDRHAWIPIRLHSPEASPWTDEHTQLSIARHPDLLRVDGAVVRVSHRLATHVRAGLPFGTNLDPTGVTFPSTQEVFR
jgi:hypothetical protein